MTYQGGRVSSFPGNPVPATADTKSSYPAFCECGHRERLHTVHCTARFTEDGIEYECPCPHFTAAKTDD